MSDAAPVQAASATPPADLVDLVDLGRSAPATSAPEAKPTPPVSVRKSIGDDYLVSMEDGKGTRLSSATSRSSV